jgi:dihydroorotase
MIYYRKTLFGSGPKLTAVHLVEKPVEWLDTRGNKQPGMYSLVPVQTIRAGRPFGRPFVAPFSY